MELFTPDVPKANPAVQQQQADERARAEAANRAATQDQLRVETLISGRQRGIRSLLGSFGSGSSMLGSG